jgi:hypothetical protein
MLKRTVQAALIGYVVLGLLTRGLEEVGLHARCEWDPDCWCKRPSLTVFRWVFPRGTKDHGIECSYGDEAATILSVMRPQFPPESWSEGGTRRHFSRAKIIALQSWRRWRFIATG